MAATIRSNVSASSIEDQRLAATVLSHELTGAGSRNAPVASGSDQKARHSKHQPHVPRGALLPELRQSKPQRLDVVELGGVEEDVVVLVPVRLAADPRLVVYVLEEWGRLCSDGGVVPEETRQRLADLKV
eukprot:CAMPEP_0181229396 /NCGR_PEP_ID=MMETSP1096-20121128/33870_1 /TAXON_ID=156174 ORGANISM="Chrysochromulina ericina, Strain CCMP281" /NCGR_SAMPLE_ID=MMETSP1096 /ASSEMBLY_ACC=CAM_ASM_000453 /LENGTH=129 /DNA_ID=CAMNT_0023323007 /DNA_START=221 /DNA_END=610 /DNA_ORIENTATION=-